MRKVYAYQKLFSYLTIASCLFLWACGERPMGQKEDLAIQIIKGHKTEDGFSVISNIEKRRDIASRTENPWTMEPWEAGLLSQADRINDELSQYFNIFEAPGGRWVRFTYTDKDGTHEALWETDIYKKNVEGKNDLAKEFMSSPPE